MTDYANEENINISFTFSISLYFNQEFSVPFSSI